MLGAKILSHMQKDYKCKVKQLPGDILIFLQYLRRGMQVSDVEAGVPAKIRVQIWQIEKIVLSLPG